MEHYQPVVPLDYNDIIYVRVPLLLLFPAAYMIFSEWPWTSNPTTPPYPHYTYIFSSTLFLGAPCGINIYIYILDPNPLITTQTLQFFLGSHFISKCFIHLLHSTMEVILTFGWSFFNHYFDNIWLGLVVLYTFSPLFYIWKV